MTRLVEFAYAGKADSAGNVSVRRRVEDVGDTPATLVAENTELREEVAHKERACEILEGENTRLAAEVERQSRRAEYFLGVVDRTDAENIRLNEALCRAWEYIACLRDEGEVPDSDHFNREAHTAAVACGLNTTEIFASINAPGRKLATSPASDKKAIRQPPVSK